MIPFLLAGMAVLLAWVAPGLLARRRGLRRAPRAALVAWQGMTVGGLLAALLAAPSALPLALGDGSALDHPWWLLAALVVSGLVLGRLLWSGHHLGRRLRRVRAEQRDLVDLVAAHHRGGRVRVLNHPTPTAYCIPGRGARVVLSQGALDALPDDQLEAVVAHEEAHLRGRHDLLLEFFGVIHASVPAPLRSAVALTEVRLLVEALADRAAVRRSGEVATARALVALAEGTSSDEDGHGTTAALRLRLLARGPAPLALSTAGYGLGTAAVALPLGLALRAWA